MGDTKKRTPIIHLIGPDGSGKTTLCRLFMDIFTEHTVLAVDVSTDNYLALSYGVTEPKTVMTLLDQIEAHPTTREAMDWALQDLPTPIAAESEADILCWGSEHETFTDYQRDMLAYGLPRLFRAYDIVIWDGPFGLAQNILKTDDIRPLLVITPQDDAYCQNLELDRAMVLLSKAEAVDVLPPTAANQIQRGNWTFIGKLPPLNPPEKRIKELPAYFEDCFHKLDLPFELKPRLV